MSVVMPRRVAVREADHRAIHVSGYDREGRDFYATPVWVTEALLRHVRFRGSVWEPCCGDGAMSTVLTAHGYSVVSTDIAAHCFGTPNIDFLACGNMPTGCRSIVTNPPYGDTGSHKGQAKFAVGDAALLAAFPSAGSGGAGSARAAGSSAMDCRPARCRRAIRSTVCGNDCADEAHSVVQHGRTHQSCATSPCMGGLRSCTPTKIITGSALCLKFCSIAFGSLVASKEPPADFAAGSVSNVAQAACFIAC